MEAGLARPSSLSETKPQEAFLVVGAVAGSMTLPVQCLSSVSILCLLHVSGPASVLRELLSPRDADDLGVASNQCESRFCKERKEQGQVGVLQVEVAPALQER